MSEMPNLTETTMSLCQYSSKSLSTTSHSPNEYNSEDLCIYIRNQHTWTFPIIIPKSKKGPTFERFFCQRSVIDRPLTYANMILKDTNRHHHKIIENKEKGNQTNTPRT